MQANRSSSRRHIHPWVLDRTIGIYGEAVMPRNSIVAVLPRWHFAVKRPNTQATTTYIHANNIFMRQAVDLVKVRLTS